MAAISWSWRNHTIGVPPESVVADGTFFDFPPAAPEGTRQFLDEFHPATVTAQTVGDRVEVTFDGMRLGIFTGSLRYTFYPGTPLIQQAALVSTHEPDTAFYYDAGLEMTSEQ